MPVSIGKFSSNWENASRPPADAPTPTMGNNFGVLTPDDCVEGFIRLARFLGFMAATAGEGVSRVDFDAGTFPAICLRFGVIMRAGEGGAGKTRCVMQACFICAFTRTLSVDSILLYSNRSFVCRITPKTLILQFCSAARITVHDNGHGCSD